MSDKKPNILLLTQITRNLSVMLEDTRQIKNDLAEIKQFFKEKKEKEKKQGEKEEYVEGWRIW